MVSYHWGVVNELIVIFIYMEIVERGRHKVNAPKSDITRGSHRVQYELVKVCYNIGAHIKPSGIMLSAVYSLLAVLVSVRNNIESALFDQAVQYLG